MSVSIADSSLNIRNVLAKFGQGAFYAYSTSTQDIPNASAETLVAISTESIDVNSWFDNTAGNYKYTPKQPGYYLLFAHFVISDDADFVEGTDTFTIYFRKNGTAVDPKPRTQKRALPLYIIGIHEANGSSDYFDVCCTQNGDGAVTIDEAFFGGVFVSYNNP